MMGYENVVKTKGLTAKMSNRTKIKWKLIKPHCHISFPLSQSCADPKTRPSLLKDKGMESAIKYINKKFPNIDFRGNIVSLTATSVLYFCFSFVPYCFRQEDIQYLYNTNVFGAHEIIILEY